MPQFSGRCRVNPITNPVRKHHVTFRIDYSFVALSSASPSILSARADCSLRGFGIDLLRTLQMGVVKAGTWLIFVY